MDKFLEKIILGCAIVFAVGWGGLAAERIRDAEVFIHSLVVTMRIKTLDARVLSDLVDRESFNAYADKIRIKKASNALSNGFDAIEESGVKNIISGLENLMSAVNATDLATDDGLKVALSKVEIRGFDRASSNYYFRMANWWSGKSVLDAVDMDCKVSGIRDSDDSLSCFIASNEFIFEIHSAGRKHPWKLVAVYPKS